MKHLMIDLETMGTAFTAPVLAIGAVYFDPETGELGDRFYGGIDMEDACRHGKASGSTISWWLKQSDAARQAVREGKHPSAMVFTKFEAFCKKHGTAVQPWGNGATFDISILEYAYAKILDRRPPWEYWNVRDCRTVKEMAKGVTDFTADRAGTHHQALDDAIYQAQWISHYWQALCGKTPRAPASTAPAAVDDLLAI